jgi:hypothetical protein
VDASVRPGAAAPVSPALPPPLVKFSRHPLRWIQNKVVLSIDAVVLAHVGVLIMAALYYLITQANPTVKHWWDTTVTPASLRHDIRDVGEGVLASCLAQAIVWNPFKRGHQRTGRVFREMHDRFGVPVSLAAVASAAVVGAIAFLVGEGILHLMSVHPTPHAVTGSLWNRTTTLWRSNWDKKALGFIAALAARRPLHIVFDEAQAYFAGRRASAGIGLRFYHPPVFRARYNYLTENRHEVRHHSELLSYVMGVAVIAGVGLAGYGYYVLTYKA